MSQVGRVRENVYALILLQLDGFHSATIALNNTVFINNFKIVVSFPKIIIIIIIIIIIESIRCFLGSTFRSSMGSYSGRPLSLYT